jgi:hypothetical protein
MRRTLLLACVVGCSEPHMIARPLPALVAAQPPVLNATVSHLLLEPHETLIWEVSSEGLTIGRAELVVGDDDVHSRFATDGLASAFTRVHYDLSTVLDRAAARPSTAHELLDVDGTRTEIASVFDGPIYTIGDAHHTAPATAHTLHSALGWLRAWASPGARAVSLFVVYMGTVFRLDVAQPMQEEGRLRIDGHAGEIAISIWFSESSARIPLRIVATSGSLHLTAELIEST